MELQPGTQIGPYKILSLVGEGGMGQVYRARDDRLGRDVALKLLPEELAEQPDLARRLLAEARAAGRLDHPNILAVHDVGLHEGRPYMVTELLEGRPLREQMKGGPLTVRRAIGLGIQLAQGLAAAHAKGIVHRDIKPENLFLTNDGRLKILDFGLAKQDPASVTVTEATMELEKTREGVVMGTLGYLSPEQIQGAPVDHRADLFAFGVILFEMLAGHRPFLGHTSQDVLFAILKRPAPDLQVANPRVPTQAVQLVERCLEKDPALRYQSTRDLAHALELIPLSDASRPLGEAGAGVRLPWRTLRPWLLGAGLVLVAGLAGWAAAFRRPGPRLPTFRQMTFRRGTVYTARFMAGETGIVYSAQWDGGARALFYTPPGTLDSLSLQQPGTDVQGLLASGEILTIRRGRGSFPPGTLARSPLGIGPAKDLLEGVIWADGRPDLPDQAVIREQGGRYRLEYPVGKVLYETTSYLSYPKVSPRGDRVAFLEFQDPNEDAGLVATVDLQGRHVPVTGSWKSIEGVGWRGEDQLWFCASPTGNALSLYATDFRQHQRVLCRVPGRLVLHDLAPDGRVLAERNSYRSFIHAVTGPQASPADLSWLDFPELAQVSKDGRQLLFTETGDGGGANRTVYLRPTNGGAPLRLGEGTALCLSDDGTQSLIISSKADHHLERVPIGPGTPIALPPSALASYTWGCFLPGDRAALLWASEPGKGRRLYRLELAGGTPAPWGPEGFAPARGSLSPDGHWLLGTASGQVQLLSLEGQPPRLLDKLPPGLEPVAWKDMGSIVLAERKDSIRLLRCELRTLALTPLRGLAPADPAGVLGLGRISLSADCATIAYQGYRLLSDLYVIEGLD